MAMEGKTGRAGPAIQNAKFRLSPRGSRLSSSLVSSLSSFNLESLRLTSSKPQSWNRSISGSSSGRSGVLGRVESALIEALATSSGVSGRSPAWRSLTEGGVVLLAFRMGVS